MSTSASSSAGASTSSSASGCRLITAEPPRSPSSASSSGKYRAGKRQGFPRTPPWARAAMRSGCSSQASMSRATVSRRSSGWSAVMKSAAAQGRTASSPSRTVRLAPRSGSAFITGVKPNFSARASPSRRAVTSATEPRRSAGTASAARRRRLTPPSSAESLSPPKREEAPAAMSTQPMPCSSKRRASPRNLCNKYMTHGSTASRAANDLRSGRTASIIRGKKGGAV